MGGTYTWPCYTSRLKPRSTHCKVQNRHSSTPTILHVAQDCTISWSPGSHSNHTPHPLIYKVATSRDPFLFPKPASSSSALVPGPRISAAPPQIFELQSCLLSEDAGAVDEALLRECAAWFRPQHLQDIVVERSEAEGRCASSRVVSRRIFSLSHSIFRGREREREELQNLRSNRRTFVPIGFKSNATRGGGWTVHVYEHMLLHPTYLFVCVVIWYRCHIVCCHCVVTGAAGPAAARSFPRGALPRRWCSICRRESSWGGSASGLAWR